MNDINEYKYIPFVEIELRLGTLGNKFDPSVDCEYFNKIFKALNNYKKWVNVEKTMWVDYFFKDTSTKKKYRKSFLLDEYNNILLDSLLLKEDIYSKDYSVQNCPFDLRLSIKQEISIKDTECLLDLEKVDFIRKKYRHSFIMNDYRYDLTFVTETSNNITKEKYEIEIELLLNEENLKWSPEYTIDFLVSKFKDLACIVEQIDELKINF